MSENQEMLAAIEAAESFMDDRNPDQVMALLMPFAQQGITGRGLWLVARAITMNGDPVQAIALYREAFKHDATLPFIDVRVDDIELRLSDVEGSKSIVDFADELYQDIYELGQMDLQSGDVFIDVGANIGFVSLFVAKKYPQAQIFAFEPAPGTFGAFEKNIAQNQVQNVTALNMAINGDGRDLELLIMPGDSGASNAFGTSALVERFKQDMGATVVTVKATTLDQAFEEYGITNCKVLKLDCEGAEYEVLRGTSVLEKIDHIVMELHISTNDTKTTTPEAFRDQFINEITSRVAHPPVIRVATMVGVIQS